MESAKKIDFDGLTYRVTAAAKTPDRDAMAEVAKLIGMQPTPMIMEAQGYDWQTSNGHWIARLSGIPADNNAGDSGRDTDMAAARAGDRAGSGGLVR